MVKIVQFFKQPLFRNGQLYGYAHRRVLRDPYELSKKLFLNFDANIAKLTTF